MSKKPDATNRPQPFGAASGERSRTAPAGADNAAPPRADRRRGPRWKAHVPVFVYGHGPGEAPFHEEAYSAVVSDHGALLIMSADVPEGAKLLVVNKVTQVEQLCEVARVGRRDGPSLPVAVAFSSAAPHFWRLMAPPRPALSVPVAGIRRDTQ